MRRWERERGFTIIEMTVALLILSVVLLGLASAAGFFVRVVGMGERKAAAIQMVEDRIEAVRLDPDYGSLEAKYELTESGFPGLPGYTRETVIIRYGGVGQAMDYYKVTVRVKGPGLSGDVERTISVGAP